MTGNHKTQAQHVFSLLGGRSEAARVTGWPLTKVDSILRTGFVRCQDQAHVLQTAWAAGININPLDFVVHLMGLQRPVTTPQRSAA